MDLLLRIQDAVKDDNLNRLKSLMRSLPNEGRDVLGGFVYAIDEYVRLLTPEKWNSET